MCLTSAGQVRSIDGAEAVVAVRGTDRTISLVALVLDGRPPSPGDWLLIHTGLAVEVIDEATAAELDDMLDEVEGGPRSDA